MVYGCSAEREAREEGIPPPFILISGSPYAQHRRRAEPGLQRSCLGVGRGSAHGCREGGSSYEFATAKCSDDTGAAANDCIFASLPRSTSLWKTVPPRQV